MFFIILPIRFYVKGKKQTYCISSFHFQNFTILRGLFPLILFISVSQEDPIYAYGYFGTLFDPALACTLFCLNLGTNFIFRYLNNLNFILLLIIHV